MRYLTMRIVAGVAMALPLLLFQNAGAAELAGSALKLLTTGKTWHAPKTLYGNQASFWKWKGDGTVCVWLGSQDGKCTDEASWKIVDKRICYQFTWWLKSYDLKSACFSVVDRGNGSYEAKLPSGTRFLAFRISP